MCFSLCVCDCVCVCVDVYASGCFFVHMRANVHMCVHVCACVCMCVHLCVTPHHWCRAASGIAPRGTAGPLRTPDGNVDGLVWVYVSVCMCAHVCMRLLVCMFARLITLSQGVQSSLCQWGQGSLEQTCTSNGCVSAPVTL